jgi:hypothetical protein
MSSTVDDKEMLIFVEDFEFGASYAIVFLVLTKVILETMYFFLKVIETVYDDILL